MNIILDTETTGTGHADQVIELAIINAETAEIYFNHRFKPTVPMHPDAAKVHGIPVAHLDGCRRWRQYHQKIVDILVGADFIFGYNLGFDCRLMRQTANAFDCIWPENGPVGKDLMVPYADIAKIEFNDTYGTWKWQKLAAACDQQGIDMSDLQLHGALADCIATQRLFQKMKTDFWAYWGNNGEI